MPIYATKGSAKMDLPAAGEQTLSPGQRALVATGMAIALPDGYEAQTRPRSGLAAKHGVTVLNSLGKLDSDYSGELMVLLINHGEDHLRSTVVIANGCRKGRAAGMGCCGWAAQYWACGWWVQEYRLCFKQWLNITNKL